MIKVILQSLKSGGSFRMSDERLDKYLIDAVLSGNAKRVEYILNIGADKNARYKGDGLSCLSIAKSIKAYDVVKVLERYGAEDIEISKKRAEELGRMIFKLNIDRKDEIKKLILLGADLEVKNILGDTSFLDAVRNQNIFKAEFLMSNGADINTTSHSGRNALFYAIGLYDKKLFFKLLEQGCDVHLVDDEGYNILHKAVRCPIGGERLKTLINKGVNLNQRLKSNGMTPFGVACLWEDSYSELELVKAGCDVNMGYGDFGKTPLIDVVCSPRIKLEVLEAMLKKGVDMDYEGYMGRSVLGWALSSDVNWKDNDVWKKIALLIEYGVKIKDSEQKIIDDMCKMYGKEELVKGAFDKREERLKEERRKIEQKQKKMEEIKRKNKEEEKTRNDDNVNALKEEKNVVSGGSWLKRLFNGRG